MHFTERIRLEHSNFVHSILFRILDFEYFEFRIYGSVTL
jgi:hypothetical protein